MKFGQVIEYNKDKYFSSKIMQKMRKENQFHTSFFLKKALYEGKASGLQLRYYDIYAIYFDIVFNFAQNKNKLYETLDY